MTDVVAVVAIVGRPTVVALFLATRFLCTLTRDRVFGFGTCGMEPSLGVGGYILLRCRPLESVEPSCSLPTPLLFRSCFFFRLLRSFFLLRARRTLHRDTACPTTRPHCTRRRPHRALRRNSNAKAAGAERGRPSGRSQAGPVRAE